MGFPILFGSPENSGLKNAQFNWGCTGFGTWAGGHMVVLDPGPGLEGQVVALNPGVLDLVVHVVLHLPLVVLERFVVWLTQQGVCVV